MKSTIILPITPIYYPITYSVFIEHQENLLLYYSLLPYSNASLTDTTFTTDAVLLNAAAKRAVCGQLKVSAKTISNFIGKWQSDSIVMGGLSAPIAANQLESVINTITENHTYSEAKSLFKVFCYVYAIATSCGNLMCENREISAKNCGMKRSHYSECFDELVALKLLMIEKKWSHGVKKNGDTYGHPIICGVNENLIDSRFRYWNIEDFVDKAEKL